MIPRLANRTPPTSAMRGNFGQPRLESLAAEFTLLLQRRSWAINQIAALEQQRDIAVAGFTRLQQRLTCLLRHIEKLSPELHDRPALAAPAPLPQTQRQPVMPVPAAGKVAAIGRQTVAAPTLLAHASRPRWARRI